MWLSVHGDESTYLQHEKDADAAMAKSGGSPGLSAVHPDDLQKGSSPGLRKGRKDIRRLTCGNGQVGDGTCINGECCSEWGWCGTSAEHCGTSEPTSTDSASTVGTCGSGNVGDGICPNEGECCSEWGWCGTDPEHCGTSEPTSTGPTSIAGTCGSGNVGDGICPNEGECCSEWGWCETDPEHCGTNSAALAVEAALEAHKDGIDINILVSETSENVWIQSTVYRYNDFLEGLRVMYKDGVANKLFYMGDTSSQGHLYGLVNVAAFLAQSMKETIRYNACDENSWDLVNGMYPLSNSCGQLGQSYQDYKCSESEARMECPVNPNLEITATTNAMWYDTDFFSSEFLLFVNNSHVITPVVSTLPLCGRPGMVPRALYSVDRRLSIHSQAFGPTQRNATSLGQILPRHVMYTRAKRQVGSITHHQYQTIPDERTLRAAVSGEGV